MRSLLAEDGLYFEPCASTTMTETMASTTTAADTIQIHILRFFGGDQGIDEVTGGYHSPPAPCHQPGPCGPGAPTVGPSVGFFGGG